VDVCSDICREAFLLLIYYNNYFCSIKTYKSGAVQHALLVRRGREELRRISGGSLTGMECVGRREGGETGGTRLCPWALVEPRDYAVDIDGGSDRDVLHVGLGQAPIPRAPQPKGTHPLRECPFDAGPPLIELLTLLAGQPGLRRCECLVLVPGRQAHATSQAEVARLQQTLQSEQHAHTATRQTLTAAHAALNDVRQQHQFVQQQAQGAARRHALVEAMRTRLAAEMQRQRFCRKVAFSRVWSL
jgi:hypothetical protein